MNGVKTFETRAEFQTYVDNWFADVCMSKRQAGRLEFDITKIDREFYLVAQFKCLGETMDAKVRATEFMPPASSATNISVYTSGTTDRKNTSHNACLTEFMASPVFRLRQSLISIPYTTCTSPNAKDIKSIFVGSAIILTTTTFLTAGRNLEMLHPAKLSVIMPAKKVKIPQ